MADLGLPDAVVEAIEPAAQARIWEVRKAGLNIVMSMKGDGKPVSFIEDCAVPLEHLADYTERLTEMFARHGTSGTWYAHASVGCLHVRPILNLKQEQDVRAMRAIAEEAFAMVRAYKGAHSGEHGDGLVRSEFHEAMFGPRLVRAFEEVKDASIPTGVLNPGKIVRAPRMDDRSLFRLPAGLSRRCRSRPRSTGRPGAASRRRRDVQQQRRLPQGRPRRDVPVLPRDARTSSTSPAAAPTRCASRCPASSGPTR